MFGPSQLEPGSRQDVHKGLPLNWRQARGFWSAPISLQYQKSIFAPVFENNVILCHGRVRKLYSPASNLTLSSLQPIDLRAGLWEELNSFITAQLIWKNNYDCLFHWEVNREDRPCMTKILSPPTLCSLHLWYPKGSKARSGGSSTIT